MLLDAGHVLVVRRRSHDATALCEIVDAVQVLGFEVRAGVHTGECEVVGDKLGGVPVHFGARVASEAAPSEVLVSGTVRDLLVGSKFEFEERGTRVLSTAGGSRRE